MNANDDETAKNLRKIYFWDIFFGTLITWTSWSINLIYRAINDKEN